MRRSGRKGCGLRPGKARRGRFDYLADDGAAEPPEGIGLLATPAPVFLEGLEALS